MTLVGRVPVNPIPGPGRSMIGVSFAMLDRVGEFFGHDTNRPYIGSQVCLRQEGSRLVKKLFECLYEQGLEVRPIPLWISSRKYLPLYLKIAPHDQFTRHTLLLNEKRYHGVLLSTELGYGHISIV